jgi:hypothetical protein
VGFSLYSDDFQSAHWPGIAFQFFQVIQFAVLHRAPFAMLSFAQRG